MEENLNKLITTLTELVEELREQKTGDVVEQNVGFMGFGI